MNLVNIQKKFDKRKMVFEVIEKHENMSIFKEHYIKDQLGKAVHRFPRSLKKVSKHIEAQLDFKFHGGWKVVAFKGTRPRTRKFLRGLFKRGLRRSISFFKMIMLNQEENYIIVQDETHIYCIYQKK